MKKKKVGGAPSNTNGANDTSAGASLGASSKFGVAQRKSVIPPYLPKTLIFIPTYNERDNVGPMAEALLRLPLDADILFIDDNSPDGTGGLLDDLSQKHPRVSVVHREGKSGIGSAHQAGIAYAYDNGYERLITMDCDFTHSPHDIPRFAEQSTGADITVGSRHLEADSLPQWSLARMLLTRVGHRVTAATLGFAYDATGALRVYNLTQIPREAFGLVDEPGYAFFFHSLFVMHQNGFTIRELPIVLPARTYGHSKMTLGEVKRSVQQLGTLAVAKRVNPAQFLLKRDPGAIDPNLVDPQGWDDYWKKKDKKGGLVYETIAAAYRMMIIRRHLNQLIHREFTPGASLLHAGCGSGQVDMDLHRYVKVTAVDISVPALRIYRSENPKVHDVRHASILDLPFEDESFDGAYNLGVIEHFEGEELKTMLKEIHRVLRPGGKFVIFWPHKNATSVAVLDSVHWIMRNLGRTDRLHPPEVTLVKSKEDARSRLAAAGFEMISYEFGPDDMFVQSRVVARKI